MYLMNVLSLFDGISCGQLALDRSGIVYDKYYSSEIDRYAIRITQKNYPSTIQVGDVRNIQLGNLPKIDLLLGGSPCQDLSLLRSGDGLLGSKSRLLFEYVRILKSTTPQYYILENVVPRKSEWKDQIDLMLGVEGVLINSDRFVPQNRPRIYWTNIPIGQLPERPDWQYKFYQYRRTYFRENKSGVCPCLTSNMGTGGHNIPLHSPNLEDRLTPEECEKLQGVPSGYTYGVSNSQRYKMLGNGWTIEVVSWILSFMSLPSSDYQQVQLL